MFLFNIYFHGAHSAPAPMTRVGVVVKKRKKGDRALEVPHPATAAAAQAQVGEAIPHLLAAEQAPQDTVAPP